MSAISLHWLPGHERYVCDVPSFVDGVVWWGKPSRQHFKVGDWFRMKYKSGHVAECQLTDIDEHGFVHVAEYGSRGSLSMYGFHYTRLFGALQDRGQSFHKIRGPHKKFAMIKATWSNKRPWLTEVNQKEMKQDD